MEERNHMGAERDRREMIALLNGGDKRELRAFMQVYSRQIYERALEITRDAPRAKDATRRVLAEVAALAAKGGLKENIDAQLMALTDQTCSEAVFLDSLVDEAMRAAPEEPDAAPEGVQEAAAAPAEPAGPEPFGMALPAAEPPGTETPAVGAADMGESSRPREDGRRALQPQETAQAPRAVQTVPDLFAEDDGEVIPLDDDEGADAPDDRFLYIDGDREAEEGPEQPRRAARQQAERDPDSAGPLLVIAIILASLLVVLLVWILVVKLMADGVLPNYDFGFAQWFNAHVFKLY